MSFENSEKILSFIKYAPIVFIMILVFTITQIVLYSKEKSFQKEIQRLEVSYLEQNKARVQEEIEYVRQMIVEEKNSIEEEIRQSIKERVYEAHNLATTLYNNKQSFQDIKQALSSLVYNNGRGYYFMANDQGVGLLQPFNKELEGRVFLDFEDASGYKFVQKIVQTIHDKSENYDSYFWYKKDHTNSNFKKISFYKYFEPFDVVIGTGEYINDFEEELKQRLLEKIRKIRYGKDGYIFVYDKKGVCLSHYTKSIIGKDMYSFKDKNGRETVKELVAFSNEQKSGFMTYNATVQPSSSSNSGQKISYIQSYEPWGWIIGTGFYLEDLNNEIKAKKAILIREKENDVRNILTVSIALGIIFITISFFMSKVLKGKFKRYEEDIQQQTRNLISQEKMLTQQNKMAAMGEMMGNIAHQWRQPLSAISTIASGVKLEKEMNTLEEKSLLLYMNNIHDSVKYLSNTIDDFRNFYSPQSNPKKFFIADTIKKSLRLSNLESNTKITMIVELDSNLESMEVVNFENHLMQCLLNILNNAKDALLKSEQSINVIVLTVRQHEDAIHLRIQDNAGGVPDEIMDRIFEPYFTTKHQAKGTGIGLYMTQEIVKKHLEGSISVANSILLYEKHEFFGADFHISLPIKLS